MKSQLSLRLVAAVFLAAGQFALPAQEAPTLISVPPPSTNVTRLAPKRPPSIQTKLKQGPPGETVEQRTLRHDLELNEAKPRLNDLENGLPLLTAPGWEAKEKAFRTELAKLKDDPAFQRTHISVKPEAGKPFIPKTVAQLRAERRDADFALMRRQADKVLESRPELRDYVEQRFQWHLRLFGILGRYHGNPKVLELVQRRLQGPAEVQPDR